MTFSTSRVLFSNSFLLMDDRLFVFVFYRVIMRSHQIAGPFVRMRRQFDEIKKGDISSDFYLRKNDRLTNLANSFQEMKLGLRDLVQKDREYISFPL